MPQFYIGETKIAKVTMRNPTDKAFDYQAALYMGVDQVAMAEADFRLNAGESKQVSFSVTMPSQAGEYPVYISAFSEGRLLEHYQATENITITPQGVVIRYTNPKKGTTNTWEAWLFDIGTQSEKPDISRPGGGPPKLLTESYAFQPSGHTFLIWFRESRDYFWDDYNYGPFVVTVAGFGEFIWDGVAETLNGVKVTNLPRSTNLCAITGTVVGVNRDAGAVTIFLESAADIGGYLNTGKYFIGSTIIASGSAFAWMVGLKISAKLRMVERPIDTYGYGAGWAASEIVLAQDYPAWAYVFSGSVGKYEAHPYNAGIRKVKYQVSGDARLTSFVAALVVIDSEYPGSWGFKFMGPAPLTDMPWLADEYSYWIGGTRYHAPGYVPYWCDLQLWAHPDPDKTWTRYDWAEAEGWKLVASG